MIGITARKSTRTKFSLKTGGFIDPLLRDSKANQNSSHYSISSPKSWKVWKERTGSLPPTLIPNSGTLLVDEKERFSMRAVPWESNIFYKQEGKVQVQISPFSNVSYIDKNPTKTFTSGWNIAENINIPFVLQLI
jgi:hypothetical protein